MSLELTLAGSIAFDNDISDDNIEVPNRRTTTESDKFSKMVQTIDITETVLNLGDVDTPSAFFIKNLDPTNYVDVKVAAAGAIFARLRPDTDGDGNGGMCMISELGSGAQAPVAIADTAACRVEIFAADT